MDIAAIFAPYEHPLASTIMINEISCNNKKSGDWIEIYNYSKEPVKLDHWYLTDSKHYFRLPEVTVGHVIMLFLHKVKNSFSKVHPQQFNVIGDFGFGLDKRQESIGLFTDDGAAIDSFAYDLTPIDSSYTLSLMLPYLDNADIDNWEINYGNGSPLAANAFYLESRIKAEQELWLRVGTGIGLLLFMALMLGIKKRNPKWFQFVPPPIEEQSSIPPQEENPTPLP